MSGAIRKFQFVMAALSGLAGLAIGSAAQAEPATGSATQAQPATGNATQAENVCWAAPGNSASGHWYFYHQNHRKCWFSSETALPVKVAAVRRAKEHHAAAKVRSGRPADALAQMVSDDPDAGPIKLSEAGPIKRPDAMVEPAARDADTYEPMRLGRLPPATADTSAVGGVVAAAPPVVEKVNVDALLAAAPAAMEQRPAVTGVATRDEKPDSTLSTWIAILLMGFGILVLFSRPILNVVGTRTDPEEEHNLVSISERRPRQVPRPARRVRQ
jgi:hypothetical protein